jgi:hypothetical protein
MSSDYYGGGSGSSRRRDHGQGSRTPALDLEAAEKELDVLAEQTQAAYKAYRAASNRQDAVVDKIRELKRQIREGAATSQQPAGCGND